MSDRPPLRVVPIRDGAPLLNDIPGQLRQLADDIETGKVEPLHYLMCAAAPSDGFKPLYWGWGSLPQRHEMAGFFMHLAKLALTDAET